MPLAPDGGTTAVLRRLVSVRERDLADLRVVTPLGTANGPQGLALLAQVLFAIYIEDLEVVGAQEVDDVLGSLRIDPAALQRAIGW